MLKFKKTFSVFTLLFLGFVFLSCSAKAVADRYMKVIFIGDYGSGKSELKASYFNEPFNQYRSHDFNLSRVKKEMPYQNETFQLQIWDTVGEEQRHLPVQAFFQGSSIAFIAIDMCEAKLREFVYSDLCHKIDRWLDQVRQHTSYCRIVLAGTKTDNFSPGDLGKAEQVLNEFKSYYNSEFKSIQVILTATRDDRDAARNKVENCIRNAIDNIGIPNISPFNNIIPMHIEEVPIEEDAVRTNYVDVEIPYWIFWTTTVRKPVQEHYRRRTGTSYRLVADN